MRKISFLAFVGAIALIAGCSGGSKDTNPMPVGVVTTSPGPTTSAPSSSAPGMTPSPTASATAKSTPSPSGGATTPPATSMATPVSQINVVGVYPYPTADEAGNSSFCMSARPDHTILYAVAQYGTTGGTSSTTNDFESFNPATGAFTDTPLPGGGTTYIVPGGSFVQQQCLVVAGTTIGTSYLTGNYQDAITGYNNGSPTSLVSSGISVSGPAIPGPGSGSNVYRLNTTGGACQLYVQNAVNGVVSGNPITLMPTNAAAANEGYPCQTSYGEDTAGDIAIVAGYNSQSSFAGTAGSFTLITPSGTVSVHPDGLSAGSPLVYGPDGNFWYETALANPTMITPQGVATNVDISGATEEPPYAVYRGLHNDLLFSAAVGLIDYIPATGAQSLVTLVGPGTSTGNNVQLDSAVIGTDGYLYAQELTDTSGANPNLLKLSY